MNADAFLDTNVLIYAVQGHDARGIVARDLLARGAIISVQVLNEFANVARRKLKRSWPEVRIALDDIRSLCPVVRPITFEIHERALVLAEEGGFSVYDAVVAATALEVGCRTLWSEDMQDGRVVAGRLTVRNPFLPAS